MARPKNNTPEGQEATRKWRETMLRTYGSENEVANFFKRIGSKGGKAPTDKPKGFARNKALASLAGCKGGRISRRCGPYDVKWQDKRAEVYAMRDSGESLTDISKKTGIPYGSLRYYLNKEKSNE